MYFFAEKERQSLNSVTIKQQMVFKTSIVLVYPSLVFQIIQIQQKNVEFTIGFKHTHKNIHIHTHIIHAKTYPHTQKHTQTSIIAFRLIVMYQEVR